MHKLSARHIGINIILIALSMPVLHTCGGGSRGRRSQSVCDDAFVASEYEYGETLLPSSSDKNPTVDNFFEHGFVSPYASADVGEDIAETFTLALFRVEVFSRKVKKENIFEGRWSSPPGARGATSSAG